MSSTVSRRSVLVAGLAVPTLAACQRQRRRTEPPAPGAAALDAALADEVRLLVLYDELLTDFPALRRLRNDHAAHRAALMAAGASLVRSSTPTPTPTPTGARGRISGRSARRLLADAERAAATARTQACLSAPRSLAPLFGSLAASEAAHAVALHA